MPTERHGSRLDRPALAGRLADALDRGAVLLHAPAGAGKTMALEAALERRGGSEAWVRCSGADADPGRLLGRVVDAIRAAAPGVADALGETLAAATEPIGAERAARELAAECERLLLDPLTIVLDDAEHLESSPATGVVGVLVEATAPRLRVAIASRRPLELHVARPGPAGRLERVTAADLAFTLDETAAVLGPRAPDAEAVWDATEGWPLGVALASRSARAPGGLDALDAYLAEELLDPLEPDERAALIDSAAAPELDAVVARALQLPPGFAATLRRSGIPLRAYGGALVYHPLVRDLLLRLLESERPSEYRELLHARVAEWLDAAGRGPEAVEHWLEVPDHAAAAVARHGDALLNTAPATVARWLARIAGPERLAPELRLLEGRLAIGTGRLLDAEGPLRDAMLGFEARGEEAQAWAARLALADALTIQDRFEAAIPLAAGFERSRAPAAPMVAINAAAALAGVCEYEAAVELFERAVAVERGAPFAPFAAGFRAFWVDLQCGELDDALRRVRAAVEQLERDDPFTRLAYLLGIEAVILEERGEDEPAMETFARARRLAERSALGGYVEDVGRRFAAGVHARAGRVAEAEAELAGLSGGAGAGIGWFAGDLHVTRATIAAARGEHARAADEARRALDAGALEVWRTRARTAATLAPVLVQAGAPAAARELVERALAAQPPRASGARLLALRAWLRSLDGDEAGAAAGVAEAFADAGAGAAHLVRREKARLVPLMWSAAERGALPAGAAIAALRAAEPGGGGLLAFAGHPVAELRRAAATAAATSGHPEVPVRLAELEADPDEAVAAAARAARARLDADPPPLGFRLLGGFALRRGTFEIADDAWDRRRDAAQRLVRYLLVHRDEAVPEEDLFAAFWPGAPPAAARRSLQATTSSARAVLERGGAERGILEVSGGTYRLALRARDTLDADAFAVAAEAALAGGDRAALEGAAARWTGEPLAEDPDEPWAAATRERLTGLHGRLLEVLAETRAVAGDAAGAIDAARCRAEADPLDEDAQRRLMVLYARAGRRGHALRQYLAARRALVEGASVEPSPETTELQRRILAGEPV